MITILRLEVTDKERSALSLRLHPKALKRLATGAEIRDYLTDQWSEITAPEQSIEQPRRDSPDFVPITNDIIDDVVDDEEPAYMKSIDKVCAEYKAITNMRRILSCVSNAMFSLVNAERVSKEKHPKLTARLKELRLLVQDYRYELADMHDEEMESEA